MLPLTHMLLGALPQVAPLDPTPPAPQVRIQVDETTELRIKLTPR